ncbi:sensor histidine kinase [Nocardioides dongkuii]|uniref:sensor histidine kinase n=1 Tax=Nocardioides dongkuii TaxID=2760089 RepID=UPI0015F8A5B1|nr:histidine kinase [Nocardioides dongkuii]
MRRWWAGWTAGTEQDQVRRVDLYTRQSLYLLLWGTPLLVGVQAANTVPDDERRLLLAVAIGGLVLTAAAHRVLGDVVSLHPAYGPLPWRSMGPFLGLAAVGYVAVLPMPTEVRGFGVMVLWSALAWALGGLRDRRVSVPLVVALAVLPAAAARQLVLMPAFMLGALVIGGFFVFTVRVSLWMYSVVRELDRARVAREALAVAEERLRFSRDVHDVLGRRLSAIALQAELAASLARRGDPSAADRMLEVRGVAHEALREARELARGYGTTDLGQELEGARSLLRSAGIAVDLDVDGLPGPWHEAAGWVVRETVTNVLRHSAATRVDIGYDDGVLRVRNDRPTVPPGAAAVSGTGLRILADRLAPLGATLESGGDAEWFEVRVQLPTRAAEVPA